MSNNLSSFLNAIKMMNTPNENEWALVTSAIGTVADLASAGGAIVSVANFVTSLIDGGDPTQLLEQKILGAVQDAYDSLKIDIDQLRKNQKGEDFLQQWKDIDQWRNSLGSIFQQIPEDAKDNPPLNDVTKSSRMIECRTDLDNLEQDDQWHMLHDDQIYFYQFLTSPWLYRGGGLPSSTFPFTYEGLTFTSTLDPGADNNGLVFNYTFILAAYLQAIMMFLAIGQAYYPDFIQKDVYKQDVRTATDVLLTRYNTIKEGIVSVAAPSEDEIIPFSFQGKTDPNGTYIVSGIIAYDEQNNRYGGSSYWEVATVQTGAYFDVAPATDYIRPYGAVNLYSGYSFVGSYPDPGLPPGYYGQYPPPHSGPDAWPPPDWYLGFYGKYLLSTLARNKDVYRGIGLPGVRQTINRLKTLVGDPLLTGPDFGDWSLREVFSVLGYPANHLLAAPTVRNLAGFMQNSPPTLASAPTSLRQMLAGFPTG